MSLIYHNKEIFDQLILLNSKITSIHQVKILSQSYFLCKETHFHQDPRILNNLHGEIFLFIRLQIRIESLD